MPCYNEVGNVPTTVPRLVRAFANSGIRYEIIPVDNGSKDETWNKLAELAERFPGIVNPVRVDTNIGYGNGILQGMRHANGSWIGTVAADGQVDAEDVFRLYEACADTDGRVVGKVRRRYRMDGFLRRVISVGYNVFVRMLWPKLGSWDVNGQPRMLRREIAQAMDLESTNWLLDPEMLIKAHYMGVRVIEVNVFARMRGSGLSHVRMATCWEFFTYLLGFRFSGTLKAWRHRMAEQSPSTKLGAS
ncbi:MAG: glycosyltransferase family 2 protein [Gemmatimonadaceae bacterium]|nr:glycosyltransferase family 2 protein [Gemmatimonadaceae bacterium]